jgi:Tol biopolymer transport system component
VAGGLAKVLTTHNWSYVEDPVWLSDHSGIVFTASEAGSNADQIWLLPYPAGEARRITNDPNSYRSLSLSADSKTAIASKYESTSNLWIAPEGKAELARRVSSDEKDYVGVDGVAWTPDGRIVFSSNRSESEDLWISDRDGSNLRQLTHGEGSNFLPYVTPDGRNIVFSSTRSGMESAWKMDIDGENPVQLTHGSRSVYARITPDGKGVVFATWTVPGVFKVPLAGGEPVQLLSDFAYQPSVSPDGKLLAVSKIRHNPHSDYLEIISLANGTSIKQFDIPILAMNGNPLFWTPDSKALMYPDSRDGVGNVWLQPLAGGKPKQITNFTSDRIYSFDWSRDGKQLVVARGNSSSDIVQISHFR